MFRKFVSSADSALAGLTAVNKRIVTARNIADTGHGRLEVGRNMRRSLSWFCAVHCLLAECKDIWNLRRTTRFGQTRHRNDLQRTGPQYEMPLDRYKDRVTASCCAIDYNRARSSSSAQGILIHPLVKRSDIFWQTSVPGSGALSGLQKRTTRSVTRGLSH